MKKKKNFRQFILAQTVNPAIRMLVTIVNAAIIKSGLTPSPNRPVMGMKVEKKPCDRQAKKRNGGIPIKV